MDFLEELQQILKLIQEAETRMEHLKEAIENARETGELDGVNHNANRDTSYDITYPLSIGPAIFKGKKPISVNFGGNHSVSAYTWKMVFKTILQHCNADPEKHVALMNLRGRITGRDRVLLAKTPDGMRSPIQISDNLHAETHYDTETLLRILTTRILEPVQYDSSNISITIRNEA